MTLTAQRVLHYLLVEDNEDHADLIERCFRFGNIACEIRRVRSGAECLAYLAGDESFSNRSEYPYPDVVLMDIRMPGVLDGLNALQAIRSDPRHRCLSVMMLTSSDRNSDVTRAYELGANGYVVKSDDTNEMIDTLRQVQQSFGTLQRLPQRESEQDPAAKQTSAIVPESIDLAAFLEADQESAYQMMVSAYRKDPDEMLRMLRVTEQASSTRYAALASRFCMEQRSMFAGGKNVDWLFIQRVVMDKLPQYEDPCRMAGIVAAISAELEGNEWASGDHPSCQVWRGFSAAYLKQRWQTQPNTANRRRDEEAESLSIWATIGIAGALVLATAIALYALFGKKSSPRMEELRSAFHYRDIASVAILRL